MHLLIWNCALNNSIYLNVFSCLSWFNLLMDPVPLCTLSASTHWAFCISLIQSEEELVDNVTPDIPTWLLDVLRSSQISRVQINRPHNMEWLISLYSLYLPLAFTFKCVALNFMLLPQGLPSVRMITDQKLRSYKYIWTYFMLNKPEIHLSWAQERTSLHKHSK